VTGTGEEEQTNNLFWKLQGKKEICPPQGGGCARLKTGRGGRSYKLGPGKTTVRDAEVVRSHRPDPTLVHKLFEKKTHTMGKD